MAKLTIEIDTQNKTMSFAKDGLVVDVTDATAGCYTYSDSEGKKCKRSYASYGLQVADGTFVNHYIGFDENCDEVCEECGSGGGLSKSVAKADTMIRAAKKMCKTMNKKKCGAECKTDKKSTDDCGKCKDKK